MSECLKMVIGADSNFRESFSEVYKIATIVFFDLALLAV